jgi:hypothetical protein
MNARDVRDPSSYRMLALASTIPKVFERILDERIRAWSDRVGCLSDLQGGFRAGRGTEDQQFILNEIIAMRAESSSPTFMAFLDIAKAYDRVWLDGLWLKLQRAGLSSQLLELVRLMFRKIVRRVLVNGKPVENSRSTLVCHKELYSHRFYMRTILMACMLRCDNKAWESGCMVSWYRY